MPTSLHRHSNAKYIADALWTSLKTLSRLKIFASLHRESSRVVFRAPLSRWTGVPEVSRDTESTVNTWQHHIALWGNSTLTYVYGHYSAKGWCGVGRGVWLLRKTGTFCGSRKECKCALLPSSWDFYFRGGAEGQRISKVETPASIYFERSLCVPSRRNGQTRATEHMSGTPKYGNFLTHFRNCLPNATSGFGSLKAPHPRQVGKR